MKLGKYYIERGIVGKCVGIKQDKSCLEFDIPLHNEFPLILPGISPVVSFSEFISYDKSKYHLWCWNVNLKPYNPTVMETE